MKRIDLSRLTTSQLVQRFAKLAVEQDMALLSLAMREVNALVFKLNAVKKELKSRPSDERLALLSLYQHENMNVQLKAAKATLAVAPELARAKMEEIIASGWQPQAGEAGMSLWNIDRGVYKPS